MKKDQHVIICAEEAATAEYLLPYARMCARCLNNKGLMLLSVGRDEKPGWVEQIGVPYVGLKGDWLPAIEGMSATFGGILALTHVSAEAPRRSMSHPATLLRRFANCKSAYLCLPDGVKATPPAEVLLTIDHRRESKEKLLWSSYFARFFGSQLTVAYFDYKDGDLKMRLRNNITFMHKFFKSLAVDANEAVLQGSSFSDPDLCAAEQLKADLMIAKTTDQRERGIADLLFGTTAYRLLKKHASLPVLLLNQRDDLYILCD